MIKKTLTKIIDKILLAGIITACGGAVALGGYVLYREVDSRYHLCYNIEYYLKQKKELFNYHDLEETNSSRKNVTLDVYIDKSHVLTRFKNNKEKIFKYVSDFYKGMNVYLDINFVDSLDYSSLKPGKHLAIEILSTDKWIQKMCELEKIKTAYPSTLGQLKIILNSLRVGGIAFIDKNFILINYGEMERICDEMDDTLEDRESKEFVKETMNDKAYLEKLTKQEHRYLEELVKKNELPDLANKERAGTIVHELGHLFGLYHSDLFTNDPVPDFLKIKTDVPNLMFGSRKPNHSAEFLLGAGFNEFQKRIIHSYLSGGKVCQQLEAINFDPDRYHFFIGKANDYIEGPNYKR